MDKSVAERSDLEGIGLGWGRGQGAGESVPSGLVRVKWRWGCCAGRVRRVRLARGAAGLE